MCSACQPSARPAAILGPPLGPQARPAGWGLEPAPRGHPARAEGNRCPPVCQNRAGTRPLPRTVACAHMYPGWSRQGAWASGQGVSNITSPLSPGTCRVQPLQLKLALAGLPEDTLHVRGPTDPSLTHIHLASWAGSWVGIGKGAGDREHVQGIQEAVGLQPGWAGLGRKVT